MTDSTSSPAVADPLVIVTVRRLLALAALGFVALYLAPSWLGERELPWGVRAAWPLAALLAARWPTASWLAFVVGAPLLPIVPELRGWPPVSLLAMWLFALLVPAWVRVAWRGERRVLDHWPALYLLLAFAALVAALAPLAAGDRGPAGFFLDLQHFLRNDLVELTGQRHLFASVLAWLVMAEGVGMAWLAARFLRQRGEDGPVWLASAVAAGGTLVAAWGVRQWWLRDNLLPFWREFDPFIVRVNASFTDVNAFGSYLAGTIVVTLGLAAAARGRARAGWAAAALVMVAAAIFTASRMAWVAMVVGGLVYLVLADRAGAWARPMPWKTRRGRRMLAVAALAAAAGLAGLTGYATSVDARHVQQRSYLDTVLSTLNLRVAPADKLKGRLPLWVAACHMIEARPLTGIGLGRYYKDVSAYAPPDARLILPQENAHDYFLQLAAEAGLPTLAAWLAAIVTAVAASWRALGPADPRLGHVVCGGIGGLTAFLLTCLTGHPLLLREGQYAFWMLLAVAGSGAVSAAPASVSRRRRALTAAAMVVIIAWLPLRARGAIASVDLSRRPTGLHAVEAAADGSTFRWTGDRATFFLPAGSRRVVLSIRSLAPFPQEVEVWLDAQQVDRLRLDDHAWRDLQYLLPRVSGDRRFQPLELVVRPTWRPEGDGRDLGVMVRGVDWSR